MLKEAGVYSVRYLYSPYYLIVSVEHELRISKVVDPDTTDKVQVRLPQYLRCVRERYFRDQGQNDRAESVREGHVPPSGDNLSWR